ncbi:MAG TPA: M20/M25/M40 family metallo-hydrolase [Firmicutes bacterium]|nr:M20/M25/M40 family metallo-hydrolase [Bacillota bacterium]
MLREVQEIVELTKSFIRAKAIDASGVTQAMEIAESWLKSRGVRVYKERNQGLPMIVAFVGPTGPQDRAKVLLNGHLDVVPGKPEQFEPYESGGKLFGRGSYDMLAAAAAMMNCVASLANKSSSQAVALMLVPSEETAGEIGTGFLLQKGVTADFAICGEPTNLGIAIQSKGVLQIELEVSGKAAHGSRPWEGENAIENALHLYKQIAELPFMQAHSSCYNGPSLNLARIAAGDAINRVPDKCVIALDIRYLPGQQWQAILEEIRGLAPSSIKVISTGAPVCVDQNDPHVLLLAQAVQKYTGSPARFICQHGAADTRFFAEAGIPSVEFGPVGRNHHGEGEYVEVNSIGTFLSILKDFIEREVKA